MSKPDASGFRMHDSSSPVLVSPRVPVFSTFHLIPGGPGGSPRNDRKAVQSDTVPLTETIDTHSPGFFF